MARRSRADRGSAVAKVRVYELAKEFGVESKAVMAKLQEMGEFVRSASSTIEAPVVRRLKEAFAAQQPKQARAGRSQDGRAAAQSGAGVPSAPTVTAPAAPAATAPPPVAAVTATEDVSGTNGQSPAAPAAPREPVSPTSP